MINKKNMPRYMSLSAEELEALIQNTKNLLDKDFISDQGKLGILDTLKKMIEWQNKNFGHDNTPQDSGEIISKKTNFEKAKEKRTDPKENTKTGVPNENTKNGVTNETLLTVQSDSTRIIKQIIASKWYNNSLHGHQVTSMLPHINGMYSAPKISPYNLATNILKISEMLMKDQLKVTIDDVAPSLKGSQKQKAGPLFELCLYIIEKGLWLK